LGKNKKIKEDKIMKKRTRKKIIKIALVAVILGGYYLVNNMNQIKKGLSNEPLIKRKAVNKETADEKVKETNPNERNKMSQADTSVNSVDLNQIPDFDGETTFVAINNYAPTFSDEDKAKARSGSFEYYSELDSLGRVGVAYANLGKETMPQKGEKRGAIGRVKPSGWQSLKFESVDGKYLYNRSHLIGWQLSAENDNEKNLATGTRFFNVDGMLPFENLVADYIKNTGNHVLYRVTPIFEGDELVMRGLQMEAYSVEDDGAGVSYNVFVYNAQPGIYIDYLTGMATSTD
jgi:endonuclease